MTAARWYVLETNYDHWKPPNAHDNRRAVATRLLDRLGPDGAGSVSGLEGVLSERWCNVSNGERPVLNSHTVYTAIMDPSAGVSAGMPAGGVGAPEGRLGAGADLVASVEEEQAAVAVVAAAAAGGGGGAAAGEIPVQRAAGGAATATAQASSAEDMADLEDASEAPMLVSPSSAEVARLVVIEHRSACVQTIPSRATGLSI